MFGNATGNIKVDNNFIGVQISVNPFPEAYPIHRNKKYRVFFNVIIEMKLLWAFRRPALD